MHTGEECIVWWKTALHFAMGGSARERDSLLLLTTALIGACGLVCQLMQCRRFCSAKGHERDSAAQPRYMSLVSTHIGGQKEQPMLLLFLFLGRDKNEDLQPFS